MFVIQVHESISIGHRYKVDLQLVFPICTGWLLVGLDVLVFDGYLVGCSLACGFCCLLSCCGCSLVWSFVEYLVFV